MLAQPAASGGKAAFAGFVDGMSRHADAVAAGNGVYQDYNQRNAIQHAHVSAEIAYDYGSTVAEALGDIKEWTSDDEPDSRRDQWNNKVGRQIADYVKDHGLPKSAIDDLVMDAYKNGHLLSPKGSRPS